MYFSPDVAEHFHIGKAMKHGAKATKKGTTHAVHSVKNVKPDDIKNGTTSTFDKTKDTGKTVGKSQFGQGVRKASDKTGNLLKKGGDKTGKLVQGKSFQSGVKKTAQGAAQGASKIVSSAGNALGSALNVSGEIMTDVMWAVVVVVICILIYYAIRVSRYLRGNKRHDEDLREPEYDEEPYDKQKLRETIYNEKPPEIDDQGYVSY